MDRHSLNPAPREPRLVPWRWQMRRRAVAALDWLLPARCAVTGAVTGSVTGAARGALADGSGLEPGGAASLSVEAWSALRFIDEPFCVRCARPFEMDYGQGAECPACIAMPPAFDATRAGVIYDAVSHGLIVGFKHGDRTERARVFAGWLKRAGAPFLGPDSVLVPTPLHPARLRQRRFNQAAEIARALTKISGCVTIADGLRRVRATESQQGLSADQRRRNLAGAITLNEARLPLLQGKHVVLIDDVMTTGATLSACARAARRARPASVNALVIARVVKEGENAI